MDSIIPYAHLEKGTFLIASPEVEAGLFFHAVLILCEHSHSGSFGLVVNKQVEVELPEEILSVAQLTNPRVEICAGGPVQMHQMMLLHTSNAIPDQTIEICKGVYLGGDLQFLQETVAQENGPSLRLCFGYTGWPAGELEREFLNGDWFIHPATAPHLFETPMEELWQNLLREMGGKYATLSMIPEDLSLN